MRVFKNKPFARFARRANIDDRDLCDAVRRAEAGLIDADLGGGVLKQRIAREGQGKSGGFRSVILYRRSQRAVFVHGFAKKDQDNIQSNDLAVFRDSAAVVLAYSDRDLARALTDGHFTEVRCLEENLSQQSTRERA